MEAISISQLELSPPAERLGGLGCQGEQPSSVGQTFWNKGILKLTILRTELDLLRAIYRMSSAYFNFIILFHLIKGLGHEKCTLE